MPSEEAKLDCMAVEWMWEEDIMGETLIQNAS